MNKALLVGSIALSLGMVSTSATAFDIYITEMDWGGVSTAFGAIHSYNMGTTFGGTFFSQPWTATTLNFYAEGSGAHTWAGTSAQGAYSYNFTLTGTQFAFGISWDVIGIVDIPVLMIMDCHGYDMCTGVSTPMQTPPFPGQEGPLFNGYECVYCAVYDMNFISANTVSVDENSIMTGYTAIAQYYPGDVFTYSLTGGTDQSVFTINSNTGVLSFKSAPDFEMPVDSDSNNDYEVIVTADDGVGLTATQAVTITVKNILNDGEPVITLNNSSTIYNLLIGDTYADAGATANDPEDGDLTSSIVITSTVDTSTTGNYTVTYQVTDSGGITVTASRKVSVRENALIIDMTEMDFGVVEVVSGQISSASLGDTFTGMFFGSPWSATTLAYYAEGSESHTWAEDSPQGAYAYEFTLTGTQLAYGISWNWYGNTSVPVLMIMDCGSIDPAPGAICTGIGTPMQTPPFPGQAPAFNGVVAQPAGNEPDITLNGDSAIFLEVDSIYNDLGAIATDIEDGDLTSSIVLNNPVDTSVDGVYTVIYRVTDSDANTVYVRRTVGIGDADGDGLSFSNDNCLAVTNSNQRDTDGDGFGNYCDTDFNNDGIVNSLDIGIFKQRFFTTDVDSDVNGDGATNSLDLGLFKKMFINPPGPSGLIF
ncbi:MAG: DUF5011 domain-containing protein [Gammaproteobacteria bacterium]|nr:DUF5011 domain-containing protein [Gammaproteobacteria bacterium]